MNEQEGRADTITQSKYAGLASAAFLVAAAISYATGHKEWADGCLLGAAPSGITAAYWRLGVNWINAPLRIKDAQPTATP